MDGHKTKVLADLIIWEAMGLLTPEEFTELAALNSGNLRDGLELVLRLIGMGLLPKLRSELAKGIAEEWEHADITVDPAVIEKIALKHLEEDPLYYTKLEKCMGSPKGGGKVDWLAPLKLAYQKAANRYRKKFCGPKSRQLKYGEIHPLCANFEGPGTRIDLPEVRNAEPVNATDACAKQHDQDYEAAQTPAEIRKADDDIIDCIDKSGANDIYAKMGRAGIEGKMKLENLIPTLMAALTGEYFGSGGKPAEIQSLLFEKSRWTLPQVERWIGRHKQFEFRKVDSAKNYWRARQKPPHYRSYRTVEFGDGIKAVLGLARRREPKPA